MRITKMGLLVSTLLAFSTAFAQTAPTAPAKKKWTVLVYINGNNNLDSYGTKDIKEMEKVGSNEDLNIVVQWASAKAKNTRRLYVTKSTSSAVTSPILQTMPRLDMGDYKTLQDFMAWGIQNYPAEHYFVDVWNHGNGWKRDGQQVRNISYDDYSNNSITTPQLGMALADAAAKAGHKIDIYGSDACLMSMVEVGTEIADSVNIMVGSQETEPGDGWPYDKWLGQVVQKQAYAPADMATHLVDTYVDSYSSRSGDGVTMAAVDLAAMPAMNEAIKAFATELAPMAASEKVNFKKAITSSDNYYLTDYVDLMSLLDNMKTNVAAVSALQSVTSVRESFNKAIIYNKVYDHSGKGLSIWAPAAASTFNSSAKRYEELKFEKNTQWGSFLSSILK